LAFFLIFLFLQINHQNFIKQNNHARYYNPPVLALAMSLTHSIWQALELLLMATFSLPYLFSFIFFIRRTVEVTCAILFLISSVVSLSRTIYHRSSVLFQKRTPSAIMSVPSLNLAWKFLLLRLKIVH